MEWHTLDPDPRYRPDCDVTSFAKATYSAWTMDAPNGHLTTAVILPVRDGATLLGDCLDAIQRQTREPNEVLVVVGPSTDGTLELALRVGTKRVRVLQNPAGDRASGINVGLRETTAEVLVLVDAQARLAPDYVERSIDVLDQTGADVVGGPMRALGESVVGRAMAAALQSPFGIGDSQFHFAGEAREVESVYLGVYRSRVFEVVGQYNAALLRTEDDDMNARARAAGMRIWLDPRIRSTYRCRDSLGEIWQQYYGYGYWKVALALLRPSAIRPRHFAPAGLCIVLLVAGIVSLAIWPWTLPVLVIAYLAGAWSASLPLSGLDWRARLLFPAVTAVMHLGYGTGTLHGLLSLRRLSARARSGAES